MNNDIRGFVEELLVLLDKYNISNDRELDRLRGENKILSDINIELDSLLSSAIDNNRSYILSNITSSDGSNSNIYLCPVCNGVGKLHNSFYEYSYSDKAVECKSCNGKGYVVVDNCNKGVRL
jgi:DnaJ-class molecular chaperone